MGTTTRFSAQTLIDFTAAVLARVGLSEEDARRGAEILVDADLMGIDSHGIAHLNAHRGYAPGIKAGLVNPRPRIRAERETAATALLDGDRGFGLTVGHFAMRLAMEKARMAGCGMVTVRNSRHFGAAGYYALMATHEDMIGMAMTNAAPWMVPTNAKSKMIGTNPIAVAAPAGSEQPFLCDLATTAVAMGKLEIAEREGKPIPAGWALDENAQSTVDIARVRRGGGLTPLGSDGATSSYKGYALGQVVDLFCGVLSGAGFSIILERGASAAGHFFGAWRVDAFRDPAEFKAMVDEMQRTFRTAEPAPGAERVLLPGQREFEARAERTAQGIPLHESVVRTLVDLAAELGIAAPAPLAPQPAPA
ncbi:MAG TPA: Ldh family oxidoreductase [Dehalococcoidia bacterium]|nr:Ldh family oxidoreductase [Dehalococcoidia bacterium]